MAAVTQRINNYLGGVSRQSDDKKLPGQVRECLNGYPDPTFGLTKRPGFEHIANLGTGTTYDGGKWFFIHRTDDEKYIGVITPKPVSGNGTIAIWNVDGTQCTVTYGSGAQAYLTGDRDNYDVLTVQDTSIITNNKIVAAKVADPTFVEKTRATLVLSGIAASSTFDVTINGTSITTHTASATDTYDDVLTALKSAIDGLSISGLTVTKYAASLELDRVVSGTRTAFTISAKGGADNSKLTVFQDQVDNVSQLPTQSFNGHIVKIINTASANDTYYAKFVADDGVSGTGFYEETRSPAVSSGLDKSTVPHELINTATNAFTFRQISYTDRLVGDDITNSHPSFVGEKIQQAFFHNNRLGFLSKDNVSMSQAGEFFNFYHVSAQTVVDADPVDLSCSSIRPAALHAVIPTTQGLILFAQTQQFIMFSDTGILTPTSTIIRAISNYEMDTKVDPVDVGPNIAFISKTPSYTRTFSMVTRGQEENPQVLDIGRVVNEWVPATIDTLIASPQNQFIAMSTQSSDEIYLFRTYNDGEKNVVQAWFEWKVQGNVQGMAVDSDDMYLVTKQASQFTLTKASLSQSPSQAIIVNNDGQRVNPCVDLYATASSVVYDSTNELSKCYLPFNKVTGLTPVLVIKGSTAAGSFVESGFTITPTQDTDGTGDHFIVPKKDLTSVASDVIVGYKYTFDVELPRTYFRPDDAITDFTASLVIARMKFSVGLSGVMGFKLKQTGRMPYTKNYTGDGTTTDFPFTSTEVNFVDRNQVKVKVNGIAETNFTFLSDTEIRITTAPADGAAIMIYIDEWYNLNPEILANTYLANDVALAEQSVFSIAIHQRTDNFFLRIFNDSPFPVALNSMMWEGNYTPRFYRRKL